MKLKDARISILVSEENTSIKIKDNVSNLNIINILLTPEQLSRCLSREINVNCEAEIYTNSFKKLNKKMENTYFEFEMVYKDKDKNKNREETAIELIQILCPEGWEPDLYFRSQNSFFIKEGKEYARGIIRRWVDSLEENNKE